MDVSQEKKTTNGRTFGYFGIWLGPRTVPWVVALAPERGGRGRV